MELLDKLNILADAAKYDAACTSSGARRGSKKGYIGNTSSSLAGPSAAPPWPGAATPSRRTGGAFRC